MTTMTRKLSVEIAKRILLGRSQYSWSKLAELRINSERETQYDTEYVQENLIYLNEIPFMNIVKRRNIGTYIYTYGQSEIYWTLANNTDFTRRDRLSAFGIDVRKKGNKFFWYKHDGTIQEIDPNEYYPYKVAQAVLYLYKNNLADIYEKELRDCTPNYKRRHKTH